MGKHGASKGAAGADGGVKKPLEGVAKPPKQSFKQKAAAAAAAAPPLSSNWQTLMQKIGAGKSDKAKKKKREGEAAAAAAAGLEDVTGGRAPRQHTWLDLCPGVPSYSCRTLLPTGLATRSLNVHSWYPPHS